MAELTALELFEFMEKIHTVPEKRNSLIILTSVGPVFCKTDGKTSTMEGWGFQLTDEEWGIAEKEVGEFFSRIKALEGK